jgi:hypothetical protein
MVEGYSGAMGLSMKNHIDNRLGHTALGEGMLRVGNQTASMAADSSGSSFKEE